MSARAVNLALFSAIPILVMTGLLAWAIPAAAVPLLVLHRAIAGALIVVLAWKEGIARRSIARRASARRAATLLVGSLASLVLLLALGIGLAWTLGIVSFDHPLPYSLLNAHVIAGVALIPLLVAHAAQRARASALRDRGGRRDALRLLGACAAGVLLGALSDRIDPTRRFTGSREAAASGAASLPATIWTFDRVPDVVAAAWRLRVDGGIAGPRLVTLADLARAPTVERDAIIDCTGGWWSAQRWRGVPLSALVVPRATSRVVRVTSLTGHSATFSLSELDDLVLATHVRGEPLTAEHGAPARLVAPGHRGFAWVKWVASIDVL